LKQSFPDFRYTLRNGRRSAQPACLKCANNCRARHLTEITRLDGRVSFEGADALDMPFPDATFDVVISQEGFCHIPNKERLLAQCARVLKPGGRIAFTDILTTDRTSEETKARLQREMTFHELGSAQSYREGLEENRCEVRAVQNLGEEWRVTLVERLAMYRSRERSDR
jgi:sarcosine/dimethylglycine N-methyltransferase